MQTNIKIEVNKIIKAKTKILRMIFLLLNSQIIKFL